MGPGHGAAPAAVGATLNVATAAALGVALTIGGCASTHVLGDFTTDGCTLFPDGDGDDPARWRGCCVTHDMAYWRGGTAGERRSADSTLRDCVLACSGRPAMANLMYAGVRIEGMPLFPTWFRWGYGWGYGRGYEPLTPDEQRQADDRLTAYRLSRSGAPASRASGAR